MIRKNRTSTRIAIAAAVTTLMVSSLAAGAVAQDDQETYVIGMSQANKGEPWRQAMNDQIQAGCRPVPTRSKSSSRTRLRTTPSRSLTSRTSSSRASTC